MASPTINSLTSFSGADLIASFADEVIGEMQQISWAVQRAKTPIFTCGSPDARSFSRGNRAIAGSLVLAVFDHDSLITAMQKQWDKIAPPAMYTAAGNIAVRNSENFQQALDMVRWNQKASASNNLASGADSYGFSGSTQIEPGKQEGSNGSPKTFDGKYGEYVEDWNAGQQVYVPAGFSTIKGSNLVYSDQIPPSTLLTNAA